MTESVATHMPVLEQVVAQYKPQSVLEFGMGLHSTTLFVASCPRVVSVEMNSLEWYDRTRSEVGGANNWNPHLFMGPVRWMADLPRAEPKQWYDLVFVDGHGSSRHAQILYGLAVSKLVVCHDTQEPSYHWTAAYAAISDAGGVFSDHEVDGVNTTVVRCA